MSDVVEILLVEDHAGDVRLTQRALSRLKINTRLHVAVDGHEAMEFLHQRGNFAGAPRPKLILLDLNMPRMDGRAVLQALDGDPSLGTIPVVVLTTSDADPDVVSSFALCANSYHVKPNTFAEFVHELDRILTYWLKEARVP